MQRPFIDGNCYQPTRRLQILLFLQSKQNRNYLFCGWKISTTLLQLSVHAHKETDTRRIVDHNRVNSSSCVQETSRRNKQMSCWEPDHYPLNRSSHTSSKPMQEIKMVRLSLYRIETERLSLVTLTNVWALWPFFRTTLLGLASAQNDVAADLCPFNTCPLHPRQA